MHDHLNLSCDVGPCGCGWLTLSTLELPVHRLIGSPTAGLKHALLMVSKLLSIITVAAFILMLIW